MCLPAISAAATVFSAYSTYAQGKAQSQAYENQAAAADQNAKISAKQAEITAQNGAREEQQVRNRANAVIGAQKTAFGSSGVDSGSGSALDLLTDTRDQSESDALQTRKNSANQVWGYQVEQTNYKNQTNAARSAAKNSSTMGKIGAFTTLLNGYSSWNSKYGKK